LSLNEQLELLSISKGCYYYKLAEVDSEILKVMRFIDKEHTMFLGKGGVSMKYSVNVHFQSLNPDFRRGERKVRRLMR
jgi:hypothetical protein